MNMENEPEDQCGAIVHVYKSDQDRYNLYFQDLPPKKNSCAFRFKVVWPGTNNTHRWRCLSRVERRAEFGLWQDPSLNRWRSSCCFVQLLKWVRSAPCGAMRSEKLCRHGDFGEGG